MWKINYDFNLNSAAIDFIEKNGDFIIESNV